MQSIPSDLKFLKDCTATLVFSKAISTESATEILNDYCVNKKRSRIWEDTDCAAGSLRI